MLFSWKVNPAQYIGKTKLILLMVTLPLFVWIFCYVFFLDFLISIVRWLPGTHPVPDTNRNITELIESRGFVAESHFVTNSQGYILQLNRIVNPLFTGNRSELKPVLLFHGFECSGTLWLIVSDGVLLSNGHYIEFGLDGLPTNDSQQVGNNLGFVLAVRGFDVWLGNGRGNIYSANHTTMHTSESNFWRFSIDDMSLIDLPALIDYILNVTNHKTLSYVGHSQGNFMMLSLLSDKPQYSQYVKPFIAISPVFYMYKLNTPLRHFHIFKSILRSYPSLIPNNARFLKLYKNMCENVLIKGLCLSIYKFLSGSHEKNINLKRLATYVGNIPLGTSSWNAAQFAQIHSTGGDPRYFEYGPEEENIRRYGSSTPPLYNVSRINSSHIALIYAQDDWYNHLDNIEYLRTNMSVKLMAEYQVPDPTWNHMDLVWSHQVGIYVNTKVLDFLNRY